MKLAKWLSGNSKGKRGSVRSQMLHDPYYRLHPEEIPIAAQLGIRIDVNQAGVDDWLRLPGLSIHQARSLVALSQSGVSFHCLEDIAAALSLPVQRLRSLAPVLQFCYYGGEGEIVPTRINPNTASIEMLTRIPAVDLFLARAIVQNRQPCTYKNLADLQQRLALPGQLTTEIMHHLQF
jgi:DNA uptake protein ComE-like DNA-binding protein